MKAPKLWPAEPSQSFGVRLGYRSAQDGAHATIYVGDIGTETNRLHVLASLLGHGQEQRGVKRLFQLHVVLHLRQEMTTGSTGNMGAELAFAIGEHRRKVEQVSLPVARHFNLAQALGMANHFIYRAEAKRCHNLTQLLGNEEHEVHHVLGLAAEALAQALFVHFQTTSRPVKINTRHLFRIHVRQGAVDGRFKAFIGKEQRVEPYRLESLYRAVYGGPVRFGRAAICY